MLEKLKFSYDYFLAMETTTQVLILSFIVVALLVLFLVLIIVFVGIVLMAKVHLIHKNYFERKMEFAEDHLYVIYNTSVNVITTVAEERHCEAEKIHKYAEQCNITGEPCEPLKITVKKSLRESLEYQLAIGTGMLDRMILVSTKDRIRQVLHNIDIYTTEGQELESLKRSISKRFLYKNRNFLNRNGFNKYSLIALTDELRFTEDNAYQHLSSIVDEARRIDKREKKEIRGLILTPLKFWKWIGKWIK
jgi:hypothetical protein